MAAVATAATIAAGLALMLYLPLAPQSRRCRAPSARSCRGDPVSDAAYGLDPHSGACELGPQPGQVNVDGIRAEGVGLVVPDMLSDRAAVGDARGSAHENFQDAELGTGQGGPLPTNQHFPRRRVELEFPDHHPGRPADRGPALQRPE